MLLIVLAKKKIKNLHPPKWCAILGAVGAKSLEIIYKQFVSYSQITSSFLIFYDFLNILYSMINPMLFGSHSVTF